jgi:hypothetical protein
MATLESFSLPGNVADLGADELAALDASWQGVVGSTFARVAEFAQLYDPTEADTPDDAQHHAVPWHAFPASLNRETASAEQRALLADGSRERQDEYCEWSVERDGETIRRVTFTSEVPEYYEALWQVDRNAVLGLYHQHVSPDVELDDLHENGAYKAQNKWNFRTDGPIMHLCQESNTLGAAVLLAAQATVLRERDGHPVTQQQDLVICGGLGNPFRNSDPQIAAAINGLAATGVRITLADPLGLYIDRLETAGMRFPEGVSASDCWVVERGAQGHAVRARFEVPPDKGSLADVAINGAPITSGAQLADRVVMRIGAISHSPGSVQPRTDECG